MIRARAARARNSKNAVAEVGEQKPLPAALTEPHRMLTLVEGWQVADRVSTALALGRSRIRCCRTGGGRVADLPISHRNIWWAL
jgi:hypothetical protein